MPIATARLLCESNPRRGQKAQWQAERRKRGRAREEKERYRTRSRTTGSSTEAGVHSLLLGRSYRSPKAGSRVGTRSRVYAKAADITGNNGAKQGSRSCHPCLHRVSHRRSSEALLLLELLIYLPIYLDLREAFVVAQYIWHRAPPSSPQPPTPSPPTSPTMSQPSERPSLTPQFCFNQTALRGTLPSSHQHPRTN